jgi:hypothetical protein
MERFSQQLNSTIDFWNNMAARLGTGVLVTISELGTDAAGETINNNNNNNGNNFTHKLHIWRIFHCVKSVGQITETVSVTQDISTLQPPYDWGEVPQFKRHEQGQ